MNLFVLKKAITPFILPPGIFILAIIIVALVLLYRNQLRLGVANLVLGVMLWAFSIAPTADFLMRGLEADVSIPQNPSGDVIILLGGGIIEGVPDLTGTAVPSPLMMGRIVTAVRLYQRLELPIIVSGGAMPADDPITEAPVVKRWLVDLGVPENRIIIEDRALDTAQNARLTTVICRQQGFSRPILITAAYHLKRAQMAFEAAGMRVTPFPAYYMGSRDRAYTWQHLLPLAGTLHASANALHEYIGMVYYRVVPP